MSHMKTLTVLALLLAPVSLAAQQPELLTAVINRRKVELQGALSGPDMLLPGNYRARLVSETHESVYELRQQWEILLPGDRTRKFDLVGIRE
jgi:hypothetical protein